MKKFNKFRFNKITIREIIKNAIYFYLILYSFHIK
jgi:hypothetical protein